MDILLYADLPFEEKLEYLKNCLLDGVEVYYKNQFGFLFLKDDVLYADFYDEESRLDKYNIRYVMFNTPTKFAHIYLYKEDDLVKQFCWDVYGKNLSAAFKAVTLKYEDCKVDMFVCHHKKDYRKCFSKV